MPNKLQLLQPKAKKTSVYSNNIRNHHSPCQILLSHLKVTTDQSGPYSKCLAHSNPRSPLVKERDPDIEETEWPTAHKLVQT